MCSVEVSSCSIWLLIRLFIFSFSTFDIPQTNSGENGVAARFRQKQQSTSFVSSVYLLLSSANYSILGLHYF